MSVPAGTSHLSKTRGLVVSLWMKSTGGLIRIDSLRHIVRYGSFGKSFLQPNKNNEM